MSKFIKELNDFAVTVWKPIYEIIERQSIEFFSFGVYIPVDEDFCTRWKLTDIDFALVLDIAKYGSRTTSIEYIYKGQVIRPIFIGNLRTSEFDILSILHEAISQDTNTPKINLVENKSIVYLH